MSVEMPAAAVPLGRPDHGDAAARLGGAAEVISGCAAMAFRGDGTWENPVDQGLVFEAGTAIEETFDAVDFEWPFVIRVVAQQAREAFVRTAGALGDPLPAESLPRHWSGPLIEAFEAFIGERAQLQRPGVGRPGGG